MFPSQIDARPEASDFTDGVDSSKAGPKPAHEMRLPYLVQNYRFWYDLFIDMSNKGSKSYSFWLVNRRGCLAMTEWVWKERCRILNRRKSGTIRINTAAIN